MCKSLCGYVCANCLTCKVHPSVCVVKAMAIKYQNKSNTMVWADRGSSSITSLYLTICQFHNKVEIEFLPVHDPTPEEISRPGKNGENISVKTFCRAVVISMVAADYSHVVVFNCLSRVVCRECETSSFQSHRYPHLKLFPGGCSVVQKSRETWSTLLSWSSLLPHSPA